MRELQLLITLAAHPQRIMTREELYAEVWGGAAAPRRPLGRRLRQPPARQARRGAAGPAADPHPQRHRLPLLARWLMRRRHAAAFYIFFTSSIQPGNKLPGAPLRVWPATGRSGRALVPSTTKGDLMSSSRWLAVLASAASSRSASPPAASSERQHDSSGGGRPAATSPAKSPAPAPPRRRPPRKPGSPNSRTQTRGATISYDPVGSGGGREQFIAGGVAYAGSDAALSEEEGELKKAIEALRTRAN